MSQTKTQLVEGLSLNTSAPATALQIDASGNVNLDSNTLYVDATNNRVGIGTTSPATTLHVSGNARVGTKNSNSLEFYIGGSWSANDYYSVAWSNQYQTSSEIRGIQTEGSGSSRASALAFLTTSNGNVTSERARIDSSGRLLVGTSTAIEKGTVAGRAMLTEIVGNANSDTTGLGLYTFNANNWAPEIHFGQSASNTIGAQAAVGGNFYLGIINFAGSDGTNFRKGASISAVADGTFTSSSLPTHLQFDTTPSGSTTPVERMRIGNDGETRIPGVYSFTTAAGANVVVMNSLGALYRSTSSAKYKTSIEDLEDKYADALLACRPVWYKSTATADNADWGYWGFIAEEVAEIDPRLVFWKTKEIIYDEKGSAVEIPCEPEPEGVQYDRFVPHLLNLIKRQKEQIEYQGAAIAALEARLTALESA